MYNTLACLPIEFWYVIILLFIGFYWCSMRVKIGIGLPAATILITVFVWYIGDVIYNDYAYTHMKLFSSDILSLAWWQVIIFIFTFILITPNLNLALNGKFFKNYSQVYIIYTIGVENINFQKGLTVIFKISLKIWILLLVGAIFRFNNEYLFFLFPYLGKHPGPWVINGLGSGSDSLFALANYLELMVGSLLGVVAALSNNKRIRAYALMGIFLIWPYYIFDRTRKYILVVVLPSIIVWVFLRIRSSLMKKATLILMFYVVINAWFGFIIAHRLESSVTAAFSQSGFDFSSSSKQEHQGLNMFEELAWIITLKEKGDFLPSFGGNYIANLVNPIPRSIWPTKPTIGLDYAIARGLGGADTAAGVYATLSHGLIGQGVVNFGMIIGPMFAAFLMSIWAVILARLDLQENKIGYLPLYTLGLVLTFTMGRDITFLELYPFLFGYILCFWLNKKKIYG